MRMLVATDGSRYARAAARFLARYVPGAGKHVDVIAVTPRAPRSPHDRFRRAREVQAEWRAAAAGWTGFTARTLQSRGYDVRILVRTGEASRVVVDAAADADYDVVVVGAKGRGETPFFDVGSVALAVLEHVPASVLLVRESEPRKREQQVTREIRPFRVLIPTDGKAHSLGAIDRFVTFFREPNLAATVVSVRDSVPAEVLEELGPQKAGVLHSKLEHAARVRTHQALNRLQPHVIGATAHVLEGRPADAVIAEARATSADLILLGSRGVRRAEALHLGSVALEITRSAPCSVLVVREA
jgi:nucleotide-binding universal stress UspA family protein